MFPVQDLRISTPMEVKFSTANTFPTGSETAPRSAKFTSSQPIRIVSIDTGSRNNAAVDENGAIYSWGQGVVSNLGIGKSLHKSKKGWCTGEGEDVQLVPFKLISPGLNRYDGYQVALAGNVGFAFGTKRAVEPAEFDGTTCGLQLGGERDEDDTYEDIKLEPSDDENED